MACNTAQYDSAYSESMDVDSLVNADISDMNNKCDEIDQYLSSEKEFTVYIANNENGIILPGIKTCIDNIQTEVENQFELRKRCHQRMPQNNQQFGRVILPQEMDVDYVDNEGKTRLHLAVCRNDVELVRLLLPAHGTNINKPDQTGKTPLHYSVHNEKIMKLLLETRNINVCHQDNDGKTILHHYCTNSVENCKRDIVQIIKDKASSMLYQNGVNILLMEDQNKKPPFFYARRQGNYNVLSLLGEPQNWEEEDKKVKSRLKDAIFNKDKQEVSRILKECECIEHILCNHLNDNSESTLHYIISLCKKENTPTVNRTEINAVFEMLKEIMELDITFCGNKDGKTPFHIACHHCDERVVELLLKKCGDINHTCNEGKTPLHYAVEKGTRKKVEKLLKHNRIDLKVKDKRCKTALDIAKEKENKPLIIAIVEHLCEGLQIDSKLTISNLTSTRERNALKVILDDRKGSLEENWRLLYKQLKRQKILELKEHELAAISSNCHVELGKTLLENLQAREVTVDNLLTFAENKQRKDISELLKRYSGRKVKELDDPVKEELKVYIGLTTPGHNDWKLLCEDLEFSPEVVAEIERYTERSMGKSPTEELLDILITRSPEYKLVELYKSLNSAGIRNAAKYLVLNTIFKIGQDLIKK